MRRNRIVPFQSLLLFLAVALFSSSAHAHKVHVFAAANGNTIEGEVYAAGGAPIRNATITALGSKGEKLGETQTDQQGKFRFEPRQPVDHTFVLDDGAGHGAKYTVPAAEFSTPAPSAPARTPAPSEEVSEVGKKPEASQHHPAAFSADSSAAKQDSVEAELKALRVQITQLRREIDAFQQEVRFSDVLGGLGVIFGVMGLSFYFLGVRRKESGKPKAESGRKTETETIEL